MIVEEDFVQHLLFAGCDHAVDSRPEPFQARFGAGDCADVARNAQPFRSRSLTKFPSGTGDRERIMIDEDD